MKLTVTQANLAKALSKIGRVASSRNELAILNNILLRTDGSRLLIAATNMEIASTQYIGAKIERPGSITIPSKLVGEFVSSLPKSTVSLEVKDDHLYIKSGKFSSVINGVVADEFPELPSVDPEKSVKLDISPDKFKKAISQTILATSNDATRAVLTGVYWYTVDGNLYLAATDGYRLSEKRLMEFKQDISAIIPASTLHEVMRSLESDTDNLTIYLDEVQVSFCTDDQEIVSKLIDGKFPNYRQLIPEKSETEVVIKKADFATITKVASLFARDSGGGITIKADKEKGLLSIHSIASELGENTSEASADISVDGEITLNSRYLTEVLSIIDEDDIRFSFSGKLSPCVVQANTKDTDSLHIIMPLKR